MAFDPNSAPSAASGIFGLASLERESSVVYVPVPWEATASYGDGMAKAPAAILAASRQVDLYDADVLKPYEAGLFLRPASLKVRAWNKEARTAAKRVIAAGGVAGNASLKRAADKVNGLSARLNSWVHEQCSELLAAGKIPGVIGGDHSAPYGAMRAAAERHPALGILHFDAHHDLRAAFEGFEYSHASILYNVMQDCPNVAKLVQVGIRDFCEQEVDYVKEQAERIRVFYDNALARQRFDGRPWNEISAEIAAALPSKVWITFDIDGLDPRHCPHTGTPVPGGLDFNEAIAVLAAVARAGKAIVGFDLNEVAPDPARRDDWDANVGARLLYKLTAWTLASQGKAKLR